MSDDAMLDLVRRHVTEAGYELVDLVRAGSRSRPVLRVRADVPHSRPGHGITIEQCARLSRSLEAELEATESVGPRYVLEVSSPGVERPIRWPEHWRRYVGREVRVKARPWPGRVLATIVSVPDDDHVALQPRDGDPVTLPLAEIREATLVVHWDAIGKP